MPIVERPRAERAAATCIGEFGVKEGFPSPSLRTRAREASPSWLRGGVQAERAGRRDGRATRKTAAEAVETTHEKKNSPLPRFRVVRLAQRGFFLLLDSRLFISPLPRLGNRDHARARALSLL